MSMQSDALQPTPRPRQTMGECGVSLWGPAAPQGCEGAVIKAGGRGTACTEVLIGLKRCPRGHRRCL